MVSNFPTSLGLDKGVKQKGFPEFPKLEFILFRHFWFYEIQIMSESYRIFLKMKKKLPRKTLHKLPFNINKKKLFPCDSSSTVGTRTLRLVWNFYKLSNLLSSFFEMASKWDILSKPVLCNLFPKNLQQQKSLSKSVKMPNPGKLSMWNDQMTRLKWTLSVWLLRDTQWLRLPGVKMGAKKPRLSYPRRQVRGSRKIPESGSFNMLRTKITRGGI